MGATEERAIQNINAELEVVAPAYMQSFQCIGKECEDNCCSGVWTIPVSKIEYQRISELFDHDQCSEALEQTPTAEQTDAAYAHLKRKVDRGCFFLNEDKLCGLQVDHGIGKLPYVCSQYPRMHNRVGHNIETFGSLSCPEISRLVLLGDHDALKLSDCDLGGVASEVICEGNIPVNTTSYYEANLELVRDTFISIFQNDQYSFLSRMFFAAYFADRTRSYFSREEKRNPEVALMEAVSEITNTETLSRLEQAWPSQLTSSTKAMAVVESLLRERMQYVEGSPRHDYLRGLFEEYSTGTPGGGVGESNKQSLNTLFKLYCSRRDKINEHAGKSIDDYLTNYVLHYWLKELYIHSPDLLIHVRKMIVSIALLRFMYFSHPSWSSFINDGDVVIDSELVDGIAVETFYNFSRLIEHTKGYLDSVDKFLIENSYDATPVVFGLIRL